MIRDAAMLLDRVATMVDMVSDQEQDAMDNYPENLQGSDRYAEMENAVMELDNASEYIDQAKSSLEAVL